MKKELEKALAYNLKKAISWWPILTTEVNPIQTE